MQDTFQEKDRGIVMGLRFEKVVCYYGRSYKAILDGIYLTFNFDSARRKGVRQFTIPDLYHDSSADHGDVTKTMESNLNGIVPYLRAILDDDLKMIIIARQDHRHRSNTASHIDNNGIIG